MDMNVATEIVGGQLISLNDDGLQFKIDGKPRSWKRPGIRFQRGGRVRVYNPCKVHQRRWLAMVRTLLEAEGRQGYRFDRTAELQVEVVFQFQRSGTDTSITSQACADLDNLSKFVLDALQGPNGLVVNDAQISRMLVEKRFGGTPFTMVSLHKRLVDLTLDGSGGTSSEDSESSDSGNEL